jgi:arginyl-tRNA synthetase
MSIESLIKNIFKNEFSDIEIEKINISVPTDWSFGDLTTNIAFIESKKRQLSPQVIATQIADKIKSSKPDNFEDIYAAGGFINFVLSDKYLLENLNNITHEQNDWTDIKIGQDKTIIVEYFQNNVAKPPHVGHLRSAVVGDSLARIFKFLGFNVLTDTHLGDWGTQFGILIYAYKNFGDKEIILQDPVNELNKLYVEMTKRIEANPSLRELGKEEFKKLETGDEENRQLWRWFVDVSLEDFNRYHRKLGLLDFDYNLGESFYEDKMAKIFELFNQKGLVSTGETGEKYVDLEKYGLGRCILYKSDGASTYHMRDFATYIYRKENFDFYRNYYIVDNRQEHHFRQLFKVLELAGFPAQTDSRFVSLGFMSLPEGPISTRKGNIISLDNLLSQAQVQSQEIIEEKNSNLENKDQVAKMVALAAVKYFDLSHNPKTEFTFTWEKAISFEGDTGPYLQYTHARICSILRKSNILISSLDEIEIKNLELSSKERDILRKIYQFYTLVQSIADNLSPNTLCNYLFELSQLFNSFYQDVPVLLENDEGLKKVRLNLCFGVAHIIKTGLDLLGIEAPEEM